MTLFAPYIVTIHTNADGNTVSLFTLDVCHASGSALSVQADMPFLFENPCELSVSERRLVNEESNNAFSPFLLVLQQEHPPRV
jgi:hypothetical protein